MSPTLSEEKRTSRRQWWSLAAIILVSAGLRLYLAIATPLIYDEYQWTHLVDTVNLNPSEINLPIHGDQHPPGQLYWSAWGTTLFGKNLLGYRIGSVVLVTLAVTIAFLLGRTYFGASAGLLAALLIGMNEYMLGAVSRLCTEKTYLTFALLSLLFFEKAVRRPSRSAFLALGVCFGLGVVTKQTLMLWAPLFVLELFRRRESRGVWRSAGPWLGVLACLVIVSPDIYWNLTESKPGHLNEGVSFQLSKMGLGWTWGPTALYCRSLIYHMVEPTLLDYPALTILPGGVLLLCAIASVFVLRSDQARFLQILGWSIFFFFSLLGDYPDDYPAFWWADMSILPFTLLTTGLISHVPKVRWPLALGVSALFVIKVVQLTNVRDNVYPPDVAPPPERVTIEAHHQRLVWGIRHRTWGARRRPIDHVELCRLGSWRLPAWDYYQATYEIYGGILDSMSEEERADFRNWQRERNRVKRVLRRFSRRAGS